MKPKFFLVFLLTILTTSQSLFAEDSGIQLSGYYKNLFTTSKSQTTDEHFTADTQRLRVELKKVKDPWQFFIALDNEAIINDFSNTPDFEYIRSKSQDFLTQVDGDKVSVDDDHLYLKHSIYRAYIQYYNPRYQATLGKQSIDWGRMRFYSPLDLFNTTGPIDLEPDERVGVDALNVNFSSEAQSGLNLIAAPDKSQDGSSYGAKLYKTIATYDMSLFAATIKKTDTVGFSFDGYLKSAGFRGEISQSWRDDKKSFARAAVGLDYNFNEKVYALFEQFFNGGHEDNDATQLSSSYRLAREFLSFKRNLSSIFLKFTLTPLLTLSQAIIYDWDGESFVINPELIYNATQNIDLSVGVQAFGGDGNSEFGDTQHLFYTQLKWFF